MYFWAEKYFSGSSLDPQQQTSGGGQRRGSRSGSGGNIVGSVERKGSFRTDHRERVDGGGGMERLTTEDPQQQQIHRKSLGQVAAPRRESRSGAGTGRKGARKSVAAFPSRTPLALPTTGGARGSSTLSDLAAIGATSSVGMGAAISSSAAIIANILRALSVRALLMAHSLLCIWAAAETRADNSVWAFGLLAVCLVGEGFYAVVVRAGDDPKWVSPAILLYLFATAPPLWLVHASLCPPVHNSSVHSSSSLFPSLGLQAASGRADLPVPQLVLGNSLFLVLTLARWMLPRNELCREELSQILLAYMAIVTDINEMLGQLNARPMCAEPTLQRAVLGAWTLSLVQFCFVLTASRARKMRIAVASKIIATTSQRSDIRQAFYDIDIWAVLISLALQDVPFALVRLCVMNWLWTINYAQSLFLAKNLLVILLQSYRLSVLLNDRYLRPSLDTGRTRSLLEERRHSMAQSAVLGANKESMSKASKSGAGKEAPTATGNSNNGGKGAVANSSMHKREE